MLGLALVTLAACAPATDRTTPSRPNVILVLVDTLRADHMSLYGYPRPTTPFIEQLARESVVFERARSQAACTFPSVNSLLTSRYAFDFYRQETGNLGIQEANTSLAEILRAAGFRTAAVSASPIVRSTGSKENPNGGFGRGFEIFDETCLWGDAECVNARALELIEELEEPFLLYLHFMDPHGHYSPPTTYKKLFAGPYDGYDFIAAGDHNPIAEMLFSNGPQISLSQRDIQHLIDLYDDEIRYFDSQLQLLVEQLQHHDLFDRSLLVFTSDHGEEFMEHGQVGHCRGVWDTLTRIPLMMRLPGFGEGSRVHAPVQLVDVLPTLLDVLTLPARDSDFVGVSLRPLLEGGAPTRNFAFSDQSRYRASDDGRWHLILDGVELSSTLYDVVEDPLEQRDLFSGGHPAIEPLGEALNTWLRETGQWVSFDKALAAGKAREEELRALGYLQ